MQEGREIFCKNLDFKVKEKEIRDAFSKFGTVENLAIPANVDGRRRGYFFVTFSSKVSSRIHVSSGVVILTSEIGGSDRCVGHERRNARIAAPAGYAKFLHRCQTYK